MEPLSPVPPGTGDSNGSPPVTDFATQIAQQASERLTELDARATSVTGQIEALRLEMDRIQRDKAEAQRILTAALGTSELEAAIGELESPRKVSTTPSAADEAEAEATPMDGDTADYPPEVPAAPAEEPVPPGSGAEPEPPEWPGGQWTEDEQARRTREIMDEAALEWARGNHPQPFTVNDIKRQLDVTRPTASGIVDRLQQAESILTLDEGRTFLLNQTPGEPAVEEPVENEVTPERESRPKQPSAAVTGGRRSGTQVVTLEDVRDAVVDKFGPGVKFNLPQLGEAMGQNHRTVGKYVRALHEKGILLRSGGERGPNVKYEYVLPDPRSAPRERPRHDGPRQLPKGAEAAGTKGRGVAVAHTGRPVGRSGRPGADRKKAQLGFRVKDRKKK